MYICFDVNLLFFSYFFLFSCFLFGNNFLSIFDFCSLFLRDYFVFRDFSFSDNIDFYFEVVAPSKAGLHD